MTTPLDRAKASLREQIRARRQNVPVTTCVSAATAVRARLWEHPVWSTAKTVLLFAPLPDELDIWPLLARGIAAGKTMALPAMISGTNSYTTRQVSDLERDLITGKFGIREPAATCPEVPLNRLDLALVPGVAFDPRGGRLGRGKG